MERIGPYELRGELGRGAMGVVYRAYREDLKREFALKVILAGADASPEAVARFQREAQAAARLSNHPGIVGVHDIGEADGKVYFAMDLVEGRSLAGELDLGDTSMRGLVGYIAQAAHAVEHAHAAGILHRDLKPANILITPDGNALVADFGLAKVSDADPEATRLTQTGQIMGTPAYMPPEQANGDALDARSDVYALGATLYEVLCGAPPFQGDSLHQLLYRVLREDPKPPRTCDPRIPAPLDTITLKCLEKVRARRYPSAGGLAADLERWARGESISARPPTRLERAGRWLKRHKALVTTAAVVAISVAVGVGALVIPQWRAAASAAERAQEAERLKTEALERQTAAQPHLDLGREIAVRLDRLRGRDRTSRADSQKLLTLALAAFARAIEADPACVQAFVECSRVNTLVGNLAEARAWADRAVGVDPNYVPARLARAIVVLETVATGSQGGRVGATLTLTPQQQADQRVAEADLAVIQGGTADAEVRLLADAFTAYARGEFIIAANLFARVSNARIADPLPARWAAAAYLNGEEYRAALKAYAVAADLTPHDLQVLWGRGFARQSLGDEKGAVEDYDRVLRMQPNHDGARAGRGAVRIALGQLEGGIADLDRVLKRWPDNALVLTNRGAAREKQGDHVGALTDYDTAIGHDPAFHGARRNRGNLCMRLGRWADAYADFSTLLEAQPDDVQIRFWRAMAAGRVGRYAEAIAECTEVLRRDPRYLAALRMRAHTKQRADDVAGAVEDFERLLQQTPDASEFYRPVQTELAEARRLLATQKR